MLSLAGTAGALTPPMQELVARLQPIVDAQAVLWNTSFSVGLTARGETIAVASGMNRFEPTPSRVDTNSLYPMGSATKMYTAVAALQAAEAGRIDLDAPVAPLVDPLLKSAIGQTLGQLWGANASFIDSVTMRQLLGMRSGMPDYDDAALQAWTLNVSNIGKDLTPIDFMQDWTPKSSLFDFARAEAVAPKEKRTLSFTLEAHQRERVGFDGRPVLPAAGTTYNVQCRGLGDAKTAVKQIVV